MNEMKKQAMKQNLILIGSALAMMMVIIFLILSLLRALGEL